MPLAPLAAVCSCRPACRLPLAILAPTHVHVVAFSPAVWHLCTPPLPPSRDHRRSPAKPAPGPPDRLRARPWIRGCDKSAKEQGHNETKQLGMGIWYEELQHGVPWDKRHCHGRSMLATQHIWSCSVSMLCGSMDLWLCHLRVACACTCCAAFCLARHVAPRPRSSRFSRFCPAKDPSGVAGQPRGSLWRPVPPLFATTLVLVPAARTLGTGGARVVRIHWGHCALAHWVY